MPRLSRKTPRRPFDPGRPPASADLYEGLQSATPVTQIDPEVSKVPGLSRKTPRRPFDPGRPPASADLYEGTETTTPVLCCVVLCVVRCVLCVVCCVLCVVCCVLVVVVVVVVVVDDEDEEEAGGRGWADGGGVPQQKQKPHNTMWRKTGVIPNSVWGTMQAKKSAHVFIPSLGEVS